MKDKLDKVLTLWKELIALRPKITEEAAWPNRTEAFAVIPKTKPESRPPGNEYYLGLRDDVDHLLIEVTRSVNDGIYKLLKMIEKVEELPGFGQAIPIKKRIEKGVRR